ncbi:MAG: IS200/IS605 family transposase [Pyrinomonadaceae bacterium]
MSHTYTNLITHNVFGTKKRIGLISDKIKPELHAYLGGLVRELKGKPIKINGINDHVHILASLPPTVSTAEAMRFIKTNSSKWVSRKFNRPFEWQPGYGASSVSRSGMDRVVKYIENQVEHHRKFDFRTEFLTLLKKYEVEFDKEFLWK